jgi:hypothetical protein
MNTIQKISLGLSLLMMGAIACVKEQIPAGLILAPTVSFSDTTYTITTIPAAQERVIFVEEATGVHCVNCPAGAAELKINQSSLIQIGYFQRLYTLRF